MRRTVKLGLGALIVGAAVIAAVWLWRQSQASKDDYDYAAAFEAPAAGDSAPLFRIADVVGKNADELRTVLGPPEYCEASLYSSRCSYAPGRTEVVFIDGRADWLTVNALGETPFAPAALMRIGLAAAAPGEHSGSELVWTRIEGLREVRVVGDGAQKVSFIRVKAKT